MKLRILTDNEICESFWYCWKWICSKIQLFNGLPLSLLLQGPLYLKKQWSALKSRCNVLCDCGDKHREGNPTSYTLWVILNIGASSDSLLRHIFFQLPSCRTTSKVHSRAVANVWSWSSKNVYWQYNTQPECHGGVKRDADFFAPVSRDDDLSWLAGGLTNLTTSIHPQLQSRSHKDWLGWKVFPSNKSWSNNRLFCLDLILWSIF